MAPTVGEDLELLKSLRQAAGRLHVPYPVCRRLLLLQLELLGDARDVVELFEEHVAPVLRKRPGLRQDLIRRAHEFAVQLATITVPFMGRG